VSRSLPSRSVVVLIVVGVAVVASTAALAGWYRWGREKPVAYDHRGALATPVQLAPVVQVEYADCPTPPPSPRWRDGPDETCLLLGDVELTVDRVVGLRRSTYFELPALDLVLEPADAEAYEKLTRKTHQKQLAHLVNGELIWAPTIGEAITDGTLVLVVTPTSAADEMRDRLRGRTG